MNLYLDPFFFLLQKFPQNLWGQIIAIKKRVPILNKFYFMQWGESPDTLII